MRIIQLDRGFLRQLIPIRVVALETTHQVGHRTRDQEIFLQKAQALPLHRGIIGIEQAGERFRLKGLAQRANEIAASEFLEIEVVGCARGPETESIDSLSAIAYDRTVIRHSEQARGPVPDNPKLTRLQLEGDVQLDFHLLVWPGNLPGITVAEPIVWVLLLPAIHDRWLEHAVFIPQTISRGWKSHSGHRVEVARCQTAQASVTQARIRL